MPLEDMSFPAMSLREFGEEDWEDGEFLCQTECLLILPVFAKERKQPKGERILRQPFFWSPTPTEWEGIEKEWRMFQKAVNSGAAKVRFEKRGKKMVRKNDLPPASETLLYTLDLTARTQKTSMLILWAIELLGFVFGLTKNISKQF